MTHKIKTLILSISTLLALTLPSLVPATALAAANVTPKDIKSGLCNGVDVNIPANGSSNPSNTCATNGTSEDLSTKIAHVINWISAIIGVVAVIMIIYGGFRYITSSGNEQSVASARKTILYALVGLVIVALSQLIVKFVLQNVS